jgi:hypothetical protein
MRLINIILIDYDLFIAFCSVSTLLFFSILMEYHFPFPVYGFTLFSTLGTYNLFRAYKTFKNFYTDWKSIRFYIVVSSFLLSGFFFFLLPQDVQVFYLFVGFLTMLYKFNIFGFISLRSLPYLKSPLIATIWVLTGSIYLLLNFSHYNDLNQMNDVRRISGLLLMEFFFFIAITIPFDVFGMLEDDIKTVPKKLGVTKSLRISKLLLILYVITSFFIYKSVAFLMASVLLATITFLSIHWSPKFQKKHLQFYLIDGTIILQTVLFYLFLRI